MLSGLSGGMGESMFPHMTAAPDKPPSAEEMEKAMEAVQFDKVVKIQSIEVRTFDLADEKEAAAYTKTRKEVMEGMQRNEVAMIFADRQFVESIPGWIVHMEWIEFKLKVDPVKPSAGAAQGDTDGKASD
jgi:hypothetical protein